MKNKTPTLCVHGYSDIKNCSICYESLISYVSKSRIHKIGRHGAVGFVTAKGRICAECNEPILDDQSTQKCAMPDCEIKAALHDHDHPNCTYSDKVEQRDWEKEFDDKFSILKKYVLYRDCIDFIDEVTQQAIAQERERWINQPANEHDARIRADERERIAEEMKGITPKMPDELFDMVDEYDDYIIGYSEAKLDALNIITNNHE